MVGLFIRNLQTFGTIIDEDALTKQLDEAKKEVNGFFHRYYCCHIFANRSDLYNNFDVYMKLSNFFTTKPIKVKIDYWHDTKMYVIEFENMLPYSDLLVK